MSAAIALAGRFWFRKTWTGKLVLLVEEETARWFARGRTRVRWRDATLLDMAEAPMRPLMGLEGASRAEYGPGRSRSAYAVPPPALQRAPV